MIADWLLELLELFSHMSLKYMDPLWFKNLCSQNIQLLYYSSYLMTGCGGCDVIVHYLEPRIEFWDPLFRL